MVVGSRWATHEQTEVKRMGLFEKLFPAKTAGKHAVEYFQTLNAYNPCFSSWKGAIYESELVRSSIDALARNTAKLQPNFNGTAKPALKTKLKQAPNEFQTWSQFLYQCRTIYEVDTTLFIVPQFDRKGDIIGVYPICPSECTIVQANNQPYLKYSFKTGKTLAIELNKCVLLTKFQYDTEFFGGGNQALKETMDLITIQNQGIQEGIKSSASFRFMAQSNNFMDPDDLIKEQKRFNKNLKVDGGFLLFPNTYRELKQINSTPFIINAEQMKLIQTNVYNYFGVNEAVLQNKAVGDEWSAFYEGAIETFSIQLSEGLTRMLYSTKEIAQGTTLMFTANRLQYMTNNDKLTVSAQMLDRGIMSRNEVRAIWNLPSIENGDCYIIRGEYYDADEKIGEEGTTNASESEQGI